MAQYIDKSAVVAEIEKRIKEVNSITKQSYEIGLYDAYKIVLSFLDTLEVKEIQEEPVSEELEEASKKYSSCIYLEEVLSDDDREVLKERLVNTFKAGALWQKENLWKPADGDDLPEVDREVIALVEENEHYKVVFAHRPPEYWDGKNILTGEVTRYEPKRYDKGGWNIPNVVIWLDLDLPKMEE